MFTDSHLIKTNSLSLFVWSMAHQLIFVFISIAIQRQIAVIAAVKNEKLLLFALAHKEIIHASVIHVSTKSLQNSKYTTSLNSKKIVMTFFAVESLKFCDIIFFRKIQH